MTPISSLSDQDSPKSHRLRPAIVAQVGTVATMRLARKEDDPRLQRIRAAKQNFGAPHSVFTRPAVTITEATQELGEEPTLQTLTSSLAAQETRSTFESTQPPPLVPTNSLFSFSGSDLADADRAMLVETGAAVDAQSPV